MKWNPDVLTAKDVIIGFNTNYNGVNEHINEQFNFPNETSRYRPDQFIGNTDRIARWIYRLEKNSPLTFNAQKWCTDWYSEEPNPRNWNNGRLVCPCTFGQARNDFRYSNGRISQNAANIMEGNSANTDYDEEILTTINNIEASTNCVHLSNPDRRRAGVRCCYRRDRSLIVGYEQFWSSSFTERYHFNINFWRWFNGDVAAQYFCCTRSQDPYYCDLYEEKRPIGSCNRYRPPWTGWMFGDPHMTTLDRIEYTFNGLGEFILEEVNFEDGSRFVVQCRMQTPVIDQNSNINATIFTAFVGAIDDGTRIEMRLNEDGTDFSILVNGTMISKTALDTASYTSDLDPDISISKIEGEFININGTDRYIASWSPDVGFSVAVSEGMLNIMFQANEEYMGQAKGLLGQWDGNPSNDFLMKNGTLLVPPAGMNLTDKQLFEFGKTWRINEEESLFTYDGNENYDTFNDLDFEPTFLSDLIAANQNTDLYNQAVATCGDNNECLFDALATQNLNIGMNTLMTDDVIIDDVNILVNFPPNITAVIDPDSVISDDDILMVQVGSTYSFSVEATDPNNDTVTFSLLNAIPGASITPFTGEFTWTPGNTDPVSLGIVASDGLANSAVVFEVRVCQCQNEGVCDFETLVEGTQILDEKFVVVTCTCPPAYTGPDCSEDFDACSDSPCFPTVLCTDNPAPNPNATCDSCPQGTVGNGFKCYDYDECLTETDDCDQICTNLLGSYDCSCNPGYQLQNDLRSCRDINECLQSNDCSENADCINTEGGYNCTCRSGYKDVNGGGTVCNDINECIQDEYPCATIATCENTPGSFICTCADGYVGSGKTCVDIDECTDNMANCNANAECSNTVGSFNCICASGYSGNGSVCVDVNECETMTASCSSSATCVNTVGSYSCLCQSGYVGDGRTCVNINECETGEFNCTELTNCVDLPGTYSCRCVDGLADYGNGTCVDVNECNTNPCDTMATCTNTYSSFTCTCPSGYTGGVVCTDIDECSINTDNCEQTCTNNAGGFICSCDSGFDLQNDGTCTPSTTCSSTTCTNGECYVSGVNELCRCNNGYETATATSCTDINECGSDDTNDCDSVNGDCQNTEPYYTCSCHAGYKIIEDTFMCEDIDECAEDTDDCHEYATCTNTEGSFNCTCNDGFTPGSTNCQDIDECNTETDNCHANATCTNSQGSFTCTCNSGYTGTGQSCFDINECESESECTGDNVVCSNTDGSFECPCIANYELNGDGDCTDIDECANANQCPTNGECENVPGSYTCTCNAGYRREGDNCVDINECDEATNNCHFDADCTNNPGGFECTCHDGFTGDGVTCNDINECTGSNDCDDNANCTNTEGSYGCTCMEGYNDVDGTGRTGQCEDVTECELNIDNCHLRANCTNTVGSFMCVCNDGYIGDGTTCEDVVECDVSTFCNGQNEMCMNSIGSYSCICEEGFTRINDDCQGAVTTSVTLAFTYIDGILVSSSTVLTAEQQTELARDLDTLLGTTSLSDDLIDAIVLSVTPDVSCNCLSIEFRVDFQAGTSITDAELSTIVNNAIGDDNLIDNNQVAGTASGTTSPTSDASSGPSGASTAAPGATTAAPGATTPAPGATTAGPGATTSAPGATTATPAATTKVQNVLIYSVTIEILGIDGTAVDFEDALNNPNSARYMEVAGHTCSAIRVVLNAAFTDYVTCTVTGFSAGSIIAEADVEFVADTDNTALEVQEELRNKAENGLVTEDGVMLNVVVDSITVNEKEEDKSDATLVIIIVISSIAGFLVVLLIMLGIMGVAIRRRRQIHSRPFSKHPAAPGVYGRRVVHNPLKGQYEDYDSFDETESEASEDSRMRHMANVIRNASRIDRQSEGGRTSMSEGLPNEYYNDFVRPYIATGSEASDLHDYHNRGFSRNYDIEY